MSCLVLSCLVIISYFSVALNAEFHVIYIQKFTASTVQIIIVLVSAKDNKETISAPNNRFASKD